MGNTLTPLSNYVLRSEACRGKFPDDPKELGLSLNKRAVLMMSYFISREVFSADCTLKAVMDGPCNNLLQVFENGVPISKFELIPEEPGYRYSFLPDKEEVVIKTLKIVMCQIMHGKRGLHLYNPPYPEPEIMVTEEVEGRSYPRRFINRAWFNWMLDCGYRPSFLRTAALRLIGNKLFPGDTENKKLKIVHDLEFEIFETKNI